MGGWFPERLPLYDLLYPCDDPDLLLDLLAVLRAHAPRRVV